MGNEQSDNSKSKRNEAQYSEAIVNQLLAAQRRVYEKKCQEYLKEAKTNNTPSPTASTSTAVPHPQPTTQNVVQPQSVLQQQFPYMQPTQSVLQVMMPPQGPTMPPSWPPHMIQSQGPPHMIQSQGPPHIMQSQGPPHMIQSQGPPHMMQSQGPTQTMQKQGPPQTMQKQGPPQMMQKQGPTQTMQKQGPPQGVQVAQDALTIQNRQQAGTNNIQAIKQAQKEMYEKKRLEIKKKEQIPKYSGTKITNELIRDFKELNLPPIGSLNALKSASLNQPGPSKPNVPTNKSTVRDQNPADGFVFVNNKGMAVSPVPSAPPEPRKKNRARSASRNRNNKTNTDEGQNCVTCKTLFGVQIYQCSNGDSSCKSCKELGRACGTCGNVITDTRNYALEVYMGERKVPCKNREDGCTLYIKLADLELHNKECPFNEHDCPQGCPWKGKLKILKHHFNNKHSQLCTADVNTELRLQDIRNASDSMNLIVIGGYNFLFYVKVLNGNIYMTTQLIGTKTSASKWLYEVHVYNKNECRRKYTYVDGCTSHREPVGDIFTEGKCSVLPKTYASTFVNNGGLTYKLFIKKAVENNKNLRGKGRD